MAHHNHTTNAGKPLYMRDDLWATGFYDFLFKAGISDSYRNRLQAIKDEAMKNLKPLSHKYPNDRK